MATVRISPDRFASFRSISCAATPAASARRSASRQRAPCWPCAPTPSPKVFPACVPLVAETLVAMLNRRVHPVIPSQGSVGASGDLAPLAHLAQVAIGEGEAVYQGRGRCPAARPCERAGIAPLALEAKEGLALLNGTQAMLALLALRAARSRNRRRHRGRRHRAFARRAARQSRGLRCAHRARFGRTPATPQPRATSNG